MSLRSSSNADLRPLYSEARRFIYPMGVSLAFHALVLSPSPVVLSLPDSTNSEQRHLDARLRNNPPMIVPVEPAIHIPAAPVRTVPARRLETPYPAPSSKPPPAPEQALRSVPESPESDAKPAVEPQRRGVDVAGLRQYHMALGQQARQFRRYPDEARTAGHGGRVTMRLAVSESGAPLGIGLLQSSKFPDLDKAALDMMFLAASHTLVPESLRGQAFSIDLAVDFNPDEAPEKIPPRLPD